MADHAAIIRPKFALVEEIFTRELGELGVAQWTKPRGGYFVSLDVRPGLARNIIDMAKCVGLTLTLLEPPFRTVTIRRTKTFVLPQPLAPWEKYMRQWKF